MNDRIKLTLSDIRPLKTAAPPPPDLAAIHAEVERAHGRLDVITESIETLFHRIDRLAASSKTCYDYEHDQIVALREMIIAVRDKVMPEHQEFLREIDAIFNRPKPSHEG